MSFKDFLLGCGQIDAQNQFYLMGDDDEDDPWEEYFQQKISKEGASVPVSSCKKPEVDKEKYPHKCPHCKAPSYNDPIFGRIDCSKCDGEGSKCKCGGKGGCKDCKCNSGGCGSGCGGCKP